MPQQPNLADKLLIFMVIAENYSLDFPLSAAWWSFILVGSAPMIFSQGHWFKLRKGPTPFFLFRVCQLPFQDYPSNEITWDICKTFLYHI